MMQLKSLVATLILGSASIAAADVRDHRTSPTTTTTASPSIAVGVHGGVVVTSPAPAPAAKKPRTWFEARGELRIGAKDIRPMPPSYRPLPAPTWVMLANNAHLDGRTVIDLRNAKRLYSKLELRAEGRGRIAIDKVVILFGNGQRQVVELDAKLNKKQPVLAIDLKGETRAIDRIVIVGKTSGRAASLDVRAL